MQILFPALILCLAWFLPESPRWLYTRGRHSEAKKVLAKYHGLGREDSVWVTMQINEYEEYLNMDGADKRWWDYSALFKQHASRYRLACNCAVAIFGQWAGNGAVDYFLDGVLESAGITEQLKKMNINLGKSCMQLTFAVVGAFFVDKLGRRPMLIGTFSTVSFIWVAAIASVAAQRKTGADSASNAFIAFIFLFNAVFAFGITPLQALYPVEVLSFEMRAKGMAFSNLSLTTAMLINQFAYPIALKNIEWKLYIVFVVWCPIQALLVYVFIPETKNRTLEVSLLVADCYSKAQYTNSNAGNRRHLQQPQPSQGFPYQEEGCDRRQWKYPRGREDLNSSIRWSILQAFVQLREIIPKCSMSRYVNCSCLCSSA